MRALLLQAFYSIRSERQLVERIDYEPSPHVLVAGLATVHRLALPG